MKSITPKHTEIKECIELENGFVIREDYYGYPEGESNLYFLNKEKKELWKAELPMDGDVFSNPMTIDGNDALSGSWKGFDCRISLTDGKIVDKVFTK